MYIHVPEREMLCKVRRAKWVAQSSSQLMLMEDSTAEHWPWTERSLKSALRQASLASEGIIICWESWNGESLLKLPRSVHHCRLWWSWGDSLMGRCLLRAMSFGNGSKAHWRGQAWCFIQGVAEMQRPRTSATTIISAWMRAKAALQICFLKSFQGYKEMRLLVVYRSSPKCIRWWVGEIRLFKKTDQEPISTGSYKMTDCRNVENGAYSAACCPSCMLAIPSTCHLD